jgi:hypothetical protein
MDSFGSNEDTNVHGNSTHTDGWGNPSNGDVYGSPPADVQGNYDPDDLCSAGDSGGGLLDAFFSLFG